MSDRPIESIDSRHMMSVILFLHENGPCRRMTIYEKVSRNGNMPSKFLQMIGCGIIEERKTEDGTMLCLTDSGTEIAEHLERIETLIS